MIPVTNKTLLTVLTATCIVLAGCGAGSPAGAPPARELVVAIPADVETFNDYQSAGEAMENAIIDLLFPTLFEEQPDFAEHPPTFAPRLAESWEFSPDHLALTVKLRRDAVWSNGFRVTAEDVLFTFRAQTSEAAGSTYVEQKAAILRVEVVDHFTVRFVFRRVYPYQLMDANDGHIVPLHAWSPIPFEKWPTTDFTPSLQSCGAFRLVSHTQQQTIVLERDPRHWSPARLDRVVFRVIPDVSSQIGQLLAGQVQLIPMVPPREVARLEASPEVRVVSLPSRLLGFLAWNNRRPALADRRVRQALGLAINRQALVDTVLHGARQGRQRSGSLQHVGLRSLPRGAALRSRPGRSPPARGRVGGRQRRRPRREGRSDSRSGAALPHHQHDARPDGRAHSVRPGAGRSEAHAAPGGVCGPDGAPGGR